MVVFSLNWAPLVIVSYSFSNLIKLHFLYIPNASLFVWTLLLIRFFRSQIYGIKWKLTFKHCWIKLKTFYLKHCFYLLIYVIHLCENDIYNLIKSFHENHGLPIWILFVTSLEVHIIISSHVFIISNLQFVCTNPTYHYLYIVAYLTSLLYCFLSYQT